MRDTNYLSLQANVICVLLALIGTAAIIKHPDWFGDTSSISGHADSVAAPVDRR